jgi:hypothetical protein
LALSDLLTGYGASKFDLPPIAGVYAGKNLVVVGDGHCVWDDLERFGCRVDHRRGSVGKIGWDFLTVNKIVEVFPGVVEHAYSNEAMLLNKFIAARRSEYEFGPVRNTHSCTDGAQHRWPWHGHGTSALGAVLAGLGMGYEQIVLCGIPLDDGHHNGEPHWRRTKFMSSEACGPAGSGPEGMDEYWKKAKVLAFEGRVKSMSGRTKLWLGAPAEKPAVEIFA